MPTRFLSDEQRGQYGRYVAPPTEDQLARYFHFDEADRALIAELRGAHNRIGFAAQLSTVRFLGIFPDEGMTIPPPVVATLARQLGDDPASSLTHYWSGRQRWRHVALIRKRYGFRDFSDAAGARFRLTRWLYALCWAGDDRPGLLLERATHWLMAHKILLPGVSTLERLIARIRHRVRDKRWCALAGAFTPDQQHRIGQLFVDDGSGQTALDNLRAAPRQLAPGELIRHLERIDAIRVQDLTLSAVAGIPEAVIERLARSGRMMRTTSLARLPEPRRAATLAALFHHLEAIALDDALDLFEGLMTETVSDAAKAYNASRMRSLRDLDTAALMLADVAELIVAEPIEGQPILEDELGALLHRMSRDDIRAAMRRTRDLARPPDDRHFDELCTYWRRVHRLFSNLLRRIAFDANSAGRPVKEALDFLSSVENWTRGSMSEAPTACISSAWRRHVFSGDDRRVTDNRAFVFAVLEAMRKALKRRDIFAVPSLRFADPTRGLLDDKSWQTSRHTILRALRRSEDARFEIAQLGCQLDRTYQRVAENLPRNADLRFDKGELILTQLDKLEEPPSLVALRRDVQNRLPKVDLPDILLETAARTGFAAAFTHVSEQRARVEGFETSLCAALIAEACNIGLEPMTRQDHAPLKRDRLSWISQNFIRDETLKAANARIVEAHDALPITRVWGGGDLASADGVRFAISKRDDLERSRQQCREAEQGLAAVKTRLTPMFERFSAVDLNDLGQKLDQARAKVDLVRQIKACEQQLVERLKTPSLAAAESKIEAAVADDADIDRMQADLVEFETLLDDQDERVTRLFHEREMADQAVSQIGGDGGVARLEEERRALLLDIEDRAERYLRLRIGSAAAEHALQLYRSCSDLQS